MPTSISLSAPGSTNGTRKQLDELDALLQRMLDLPVDPVEESNTNEGEEEADELPPPPSARPELPQPPSYVVVETAEARSLPAESDFQSQPASQTPTEPPTQTDIEENSQPDTLADPSTSEAEEWVPLRSTWKPSAQTWQPLAESWRQAKENPVKPAATPDPLPDPQLAPPPPTIAPPSAPQLEEPFQKNFPNQPEAPASAILADASGWSKNDSETASMETSPPPVEPEPTPRADDAIESHLSLTSEDAAMETPPWLLPLLWINNGFDASMAPLGVAGHWLCGSSGRQTLGLAGLACLIAAVVVAVSAGLSWPW